MGMFSRKSKTKHEEKKPETKAEERPKPPTKFVPRHVAEARNRANGVEDSAQDATGGRRRIESSIYDNSLDTSSYGHGLSSPPTPTGSRFLNASQNNYSEDGFFGQSDTRSKSLRQRPVSSHTSKAQLARGDSYMSLTALGKRPATADYYTSQYSSDSGYESADPVSALHSRAPSERDLYTTRSNNGHVLPELRLGDDPSNSLATEFMHRSSNEGIQKFNGNVPTLDLNADNRSIKSTKSNASVNKRTRFQEEPEPMPVDHMEQIRKNSDHSAGSTPPLEAQREPHDIQPVDYHSMMKLSEPQLRQTPVTKLSTAQPFSALKHSRSLRRGSLPPLRILDGFKVNKKGKILDEEGEPIGHLVEGDLLDCVRQKANAQGEVLDEYGRVVGRVQTLAPPPSPGASPVTHQPQSLADSYRPVSQAPSVQGPQPSQEPAEVHSRTATAARVEAAAPPPSNALPPSVPRITQEETEEDAASRGRRPSRESIPQIAHVSHPERPALAADGFYPQETAKAAEPEFREESSSDDEQQPLSKTNSRDFAAAPAPSIPLATLPNLESSKRPARSASERSLSELSKPYARPAMSSVPENNVPEEDAVPASPSLFAYKGEIPTVDGFAQQTARMRSKSPNGPVAPASAYAMPGPSNYMKIAANHPGAAGWSSMRPMSSSNMRRATTQFTPSASMKQPLHPALKKTASMGYDTSPNASDAGTDPSDDGRMPAYTFGGHSRTGSIGTTASVSKPRTYFTHAGRVTVDPSVEDAEKPNEKPVAATAAPASKTVDKKKSRMSLSFGRKTKAAA